MILWPFHWVRIDAGAHIQNCHSPLASSIDYQPMSTELINTDLSYLLHNIYHFRWCNKIMDKINSEKVRRGEWKYKLPKRFDLIFIYYLMYVAKMMERNYG